MRIGLHLKLVWICEVGSCVVGNERSKKFFLFGLCVFARERRSGSSRGSGLGPKKLPLFDSSLKSEISSLDALPPLNVKRRDCKRRVLVK